MPTIKKNTNRRKTSKRGLSNNTKNQIIEIFLGMLNTVKLYHWKTYSFAEHKATDDLYASLNEHIDNFVEVALGKDESRIQLFRPSIAAFNDKKKSDFKSRVYEYRKFLINMSNNLDARRDSDLLNIRDEILGDINKFLYLLTFNK
jgi:DNA-binding ferritin-like protein